MCKKPNILLIYTGGTIGMIKDSETGMLHNFNFEQLLEHIPELNLLDCEISTKSFSKPIDSTNMNPERWIRIATIIENNYDEFDGFVILHGSDTMSYTASAISLMFENLAKPIIFTGSQLPIGDLRTDAKENLITSIHIASLCKDEKPIITEVCLYFEYKLYRANRTTKINAEHFEAFDSLNYPPLVISGVNLTVNYHRLLVSNREKNLKVNKELETNVMLIKMFPGLNEGTLNHMLSYSKLKGVVLETYGSGNMPNEKWVINALKKVLERGIPIINVTQCSGGSVNMDIYKTNIQLKKMGVISGKDITTESALAKLMILLKKNISANTFKTKFETPMRGEMK